MNADPKVGEIWLHGDNLGRGYWGRARETDLAFHNKVQSRLHGGSHTEGSPAGASWFRTGDLGGYLDGELYIIGRIKDLVIVDGRAGRLGSCVLGSRRRWRASGDRRRAGPRRGQRPIRLPSSRRSVPRCRGGTRCRLPTCDWSPRALFRAPRAGNWLAGPGAPSI